MKTRKDVARVEGHYLWRNGPVSYNSVVSFFKGAMWTDPNFLDGFTCFVPVRMGYMYMETWAVSISRHVLGHERGVAVQNDQGTQEENNTAIEALFDAIDEYLVCEEAGEIPAILAEYQRTYQQGILDDFRLGNPDGPLKPDNPSTSTWPIKRHLRPEPTSKRADPRGPRQTFYKLTPQ